MILELLFVVLFIPLLVSFNNKIVKSTFVTTIFLVMVCSASAFSGGDGSLETPFLVTSWTELNETRTYLFSYFILVNNLSSVDLDYVGIGDSWIPIGDETLAFQGNFNGNNNTISDLIINLPELNYVGLFGIVSEGTILDLGLINVNVIGLWWAGSIVGWHYLSVLNNSYSSGNVTGGTYTGGLVGGSDGSIDNCYSSANVVGTDNVGGLGGFGTNVYNSFATGDVYASGNVAGGLLGITYAENKNVYATGNVISDLVTAGGLIGWLETGSMTNCYSTGNVTSAEMTGGLLGGGLAVNVTDCYSTGLVNGLVDVLEGGLIGYREILLPVVNFYYDNETSNQSFSDGGVGKTSQEMKCIITYENWSINSGSAENINGGYPYLSFQSNNDLFEWFIFGSDCSYLITPPAPPIITGNVILGTTLGINHLLSVLIIPAIIFGIIVVILFGS